MKSNGLERQRIRGDRIQWLGVEIDGIERKAVGKPQNSKAWIANEIQAVESNGLNFLPWTAGVPRPLPGATMERR
jgi:hypothetical protein